MMTLLHSLAILSEIRQIETPAEALRLYYVCAEEDIHLLSSLTDENALPSKPDTPPFNRDSTPNDLRAQAKTAKAHIIELPGALAYVTDGALPLNAVQKLVAILKEINGKSKISSQTPLALQEVANELAGRGPTWFMTEPASATAAVEPTYEVTFQNPTTNRPIPPARATLRQPGSEPSAPVKIGPNPRSTDAPVPFPALRSLAFRPAVLAVRNTATPLDHTTILRDTQAITAELDRLWSKAKAEASTEYRRFIANLPGGDAIPQNAKSFQDLSERLRKTLEGQMVTEPNKYGFSSADEVRAFLASNPPIHQARVRPFVSLMLQGAAPQPFGYRFEITQTWLAPPRPQSDRP